jgi:hypothetical protein
MGATMDAANWDGMKRFGLIADNAVLPLKLYVSSLDGQGLSMKSEYAKQMKADADRYEQAVVSFQAAVAVQDLSSVNQHFQSMVLALTDYAQQGRLNLDDDKDIPSIDEMRRMAMRRPTVAVKMNI